MDKNTITKNKRFLTILEGIFLILSSIALSLNMGYVMRSLAAPFIFLFGYDSYLVYLFFFIEGIFLILTGKFKWFDKKWKNIPFVIILIFSAILVSSITIRGFNIANSNDVIRDYFGYYNYYEGGYYTKEYINLFSVPFGGGIIGYLIATPLIYFTGDIVSIIISASVVVIMFIIIYFKYLKSLFISIKSLISNRPHKIHKTRKQKLEEKYKDSFVEETNQLLHADEVGNDEVSPIMKSNEISHLDFVNRDELIVPDNINSHRPLTATGTIERAVLDLFNDNKKPSTPFESKTVYSPIEEETKIEEINENKEENTEDNKIKVEEEIPPVVTIDEPPLIEENKIVINEIEEKENPKDEVVAEILNTKEQDILPTTKEEKVEEVKNEEIKIDIEIKNDNISWIPPSTDQLVTYQTEEQVQANIDSALEKQEIVNQVFNDFNIQAKVVDFVIGPSITRLLIDYPSTGSVKAVDKIKLDVSRRLNGTPLRFAETVPGTPYSGFEVPNPVAATVSFKEIFEALPPAESHPTAVGFGKDIAGKVIYADVCDFPHMLISGTSGSGKSVFVNSLIVTLMARTSPQDLKIVLVDPKRVEMNRYRDEPHLFCPVINDSNEAKVMLYKMVDFMNERYRIFEEADFATSLKDYNKWAKAHNKKTLPYVIIILDEYADLAYSCKEVSVPLVSICQKARACGIHVIVSTQRPSTDVITGTIKANLNTRVSLTAAGAVDSMTVLDEGGAEDLLGNGDMLVKSPLVSRTGLTRLQGCYVQGKEIAYIVNYLKANYKPEYEESFLDLSEHEPEINTISAFNSPLDGEDSDEVKYQWIKDWASTQEYVSMSKIQRECNVGFNRAGKIVRRMQDEGILATEQEGSNKGFKVINAQSRFNSAPDVDSSEITKK